jgi:hypothetical protein
MVRYGGSIRPSKSSPSDRQPQGWDQIPGFLTQIGVGSDGVVWGINSSRQIFRLQSGRLGSLCESRVTTFGTVLSSNTRSGLSEAQTAGVAVCGSSLGVRSIKFACAGLRGFSRGR